MFGRYNTDQKYKIRQILHKQIHTALKELKNNEISRMFNKTIF